MGASLDTFGATAVWELRGLLAGPERPGRAGLLRWHKGVAERQHVGAVAALLVDGDRDRFFQMLLAAAENGRRISSRFTAQGWAGPPASANLPLLAALAASDFERAGELARGAPGGWARDDGEYEDEFLWASALDALVRSPSPDPTACEARLGALEDAAPRLYLERIAIVRALLAGEGDAFEAALLDGRAAYEEELDERAGSFGLKSIDFPARQALWLEGLALIRIAERAGIDFDRPDLRFLPAIAQGPVQARLLEQGLKEGLKQGLVDLVSGGTFQ
jgi:hypothetical protein